MNKRKDENQFLYFLEGIACISVIFIHCMFPSWLGVLICGLARFAVPLFFMVSGYYLCPLDMDDEQISERIRNKCLKTGYYLALAVLLYLLWSFLYSFLTRGYGSVLQYIHDLGQPRQILSMLLLNDFTIIGGHLWFLGALLYCYIIFFIVDCNWLERSAFWIIPLLLGLHVFGRFLCGFLEIENILDIPVYIWFRNWLFMALPFFLTGYVIRRNQDQILQIFNVRKLYFLYIVGILLTTAQNVFVYYKTENDREIYLGTLFMVISMFLYALQNPERINVSWIEAVGKNYLFFVYVTHLAVIEGTDVLLTVIGMNKITLIYYVKPLFVVFVTTVGAVLWDNSFCYGTKMKSK